VDEIENELLKDEKLRSLIVEIRKMLYLKEIIGERVEELFNTTFYDEKRFDL
jgi:hypothetical protein